MRLSLPSRQLHSAWVTFGISFLSICVCFVWMSWRPMLFVKLSVQIPFPTIWIWVLPCRNTGGANSGEAGMIHLGSPNMIGHGLLPSLHTGSRHRRIMMKRCFMDTPCTAPSNRQPGAAKEAYMAWTRSKFLRQHTFWLENVFCAATACTFSTSELPNVLRTWSVFSILTSKRASRHNGPQFFICHLPRWLRTRRFSEPTFRPAGATNHWENRVFRDFTTFSLSLLWSSLFCSSLTLPTSAFPFVHIVGSLTSKLPSVNILYVGSFQKTRTQRTQQIAVPRGIPLISGKGRPASDIFIYFIYFIYYLFVCLFIYFIYLFVYLFIYWFIYPFYLFVYLSILFFKINFNFICFLCIYHFCLFISQLYFLFIWFI